MYQPAMKEEAVRSLYRMKRAFSEPMTIILDGLLSKGFALSDREKVCLVCRQEGNDAECGGCYFSRAEKKKGR